MQCEELSIDHVNHHTRPRSRVRGVISKSSRRWCTHTYVDKVVDRLLYVDTRRQRRHGGMADRTGDAGRHRTADPDLPCGKSKGRPETSPHRADTGAPDFPSLQDRGATLARTRPGRAKRSCADKDGCYYWWDYSVTVLRKEEVAV